MSIEIKSINTKPEHDPYVNMEGVPSRTTLHLDPRDRSVWVEQDYRTNSTSMDIWNDLVLAWHVHGHPGEGDMREWIEENSELLEAICDGFEEHWNGHNHVGRYTEEARAARDTIDWMIDNDAGPSNYYEFWSVESWLESSRDEIDATTTDEQLASMADEWEGTGEIVVDGDILRFITEIRDTLKMEAELESE